MTSYPKQRASGSSAYGIQGFDLEIVWESKKLVFTRNERSKFKFKRGIRGRDSIPANLIQVYG